MNSLLVYIPPCHGVQVGGGAGGPNAVDGVVGTVSGDVQTQELAAKIAQNEQLHLKVSSGIMTLLREIWEIVFVDGPNYS